MNLYTDDNPKTTLKGLGFKNKEVAIKSIQIVENYFNQMYMDQKIPGITPDNVLPKKKLNNKRDAKKYYQKQKMYRILGMSNRAKGMVDRINKNKNIKQAIQIYEKWLSKYKKSKQKGGGNHIKSCCEDIKGKKVCVRISDGKIFQLPRKFSKEKCLSGAKGFTMRSSCAPYNDCK